MGNHKNLENKENVYVKRHFLGSKVHCINDYIKFCIHKNNPGHTILHVGTNDLPLDKDPNSIVQSVIRVTATGLEPTTT